MVVLITYDLNRPGQNYDDLHGAIKELGTWAHPLESTWIIDTSYTTSQIYTHLKSRMDANDFVFAVRITEDWASYLPQAINDWLATLTY